MAPRGLVHSVESALEADQTRTLYAVEYASYPANVWRVRAIAVRELEHVPLIWKQPPHPTLSPSEGERVA